MNTRLDPRELAIRLASRSSCRISVAAVISDSRGVFAWGWNHAGANGLGIHAEHHAILRANKRRLPFATITVAGFRRKTNNVVLSRPCLNCQFLIKAFSIKTTQYILKNGDWRSEKLRFDF